MARRSRKPFRWPVALTEALLLPCLFANAMAADSATSAAATKVAGGSAANTDTPGSLSAMTADPADVMASLGATDLYLETTLNGADRGLAHYGYRDGELWATRATLQQLGFKLPGDTPSLMRVDSLQGVQVHYDRQRQNASIVAPLGLLRLDTRVLNTRTTPVPHASASPGLLLNYNLYGTRGNHGTGSLSAYTELRAFNDAGVFSNTALSQMTHADDGWRTRSVRLDTSWSSSFPEKLLTATIGDTLTAATSWTRSTRIGGIQVGTNFGLQPYRVTTPLPEFFGSATLPSQVQLYINGLKQYSGHVPAGPFQLDAVPGINGAGKAQVVLTNVLGQVTTLDFSLYDTQQLLRQGLTDWSAELGYVRENYGLRSFDYGHDPMVSGTWRRGLSNDFTAEAHLEATRRLADAGLGGAWLLGTAGVLSGSVAHSTYRGTRGTQLGLGYDWTNSRLHFAVNGMRAIGDYLDVAALYGAPPPSRSAAAQLGFNTGPAGSFGVSYVYLRYRQQAGFYDLYPGVYWPQTANRYASAYWFKALGRGASIDFNVNQNLDRSRDRSFFLSITLSLDSRTYMTASLDHEGNRNLVGMDVTRSIPTAGGLGWRLQAQQGGGTHAGLAELDYLGRYGRVQAGVNDYGGDSYAYANATGSVVLMGGGLFASRTIYNGFAVASTDGIPHVPVKLENNVVGTTNDRGLLLVTPLNAYQANKLSIDPLGLPADVRIGRVDIPTTPTDRAGTLVDFGIVPIRAASVVLVDGTGKPLPLGSRVRIHGRAGQPALVGFDGTVYLDGLAPHNVLDVVTPSGTCRAAFDYRGQGGSIPQIGPLTCAQGGLP